jgi:hypothetical protein
MKIIAYFCPFHEVKLIKPVWNLWSVLLWEAHPIWLSWSKQLRYSTISGYLLK